MVSVVRVVSLLYGFVDTYPPNSTYGFHCIVVMEDLITLFNPSGAGGG